MAKYIPGLMDVAIQGMLDDIDTREKVAQPSYKDKEQLDFQILLTENNYVNPANIHICFPIKIKKKSNNSSDIDDDLITVNNLFAHWVKEISITKYGSDRELTTNIFALGTISIFSPNATTPSKRQPKSNAKTFSIQ